MYVCWYNYGGQPAVSVPQSSAAISVCGAPVPPLGPPPVTALHQQPAAEYLIPVSPQTLLSHLAIPRKRGSEELMSHGPMVTNGTGLSPQLQGEMNDAKKVKLDSGANPPSRVVHIRSLPHEAAETDIVQLGMPFGKMTNVLVLKQKNQAFLEFQDESAAINMVSYYQTNPAQVRLKPCYVQFSNHKELKTDASHSFQNANAQAALQAAQAVMVSGNPDEQTTILRVIVDNVLYPVTLEVLHQLFSRFGKVLKIITFTKNNTFQALIQFSDPISATTAKASLDGQNIYNGCNTLKIDYSKLTNLNVKYNNDKSRDFTRPDLPSGDPALDQLQMGGAPGMVTSPFTAVPGFGAASPAALSAAVAQGAHAFGLAGGVPMAGFGMAAPGAFGAAARLGMPLAAQGGSSVILVSNLDEEKVTPDALFTLFGVYGDVHRVKILFNKKDNALVQMADPHQAQLAITYLDKVRVWGKNIRVAQSRHAVVQMPKEGQPDAGLTKDFVNSPLHRFKRPGSKNCQNIFPPSAVLHLSNIPSSVTEDQIQAWFSDYGTVRAFKFFQKDRKMALIQMSSVDEAIHALIGMHNKQVGENSHLRVSFSKSTI